MKEFIVTMPFTGIAMKTIEAENEKEAIAKFLDESTFPIKNYASGQEAEIQQIEFCEKIV